jgi:uncharacterized iron-regulated protein
VSLLDGGFTQPLGREHPLAGRIYDPTTRQLTDLATLDRKLASARWLIVGETHDNVDHHRLEAALLGQFFRHHPRAAVAFEMLDEDVREVLSGPLPDDPDDFARRVKWSETGWPEFAQYRPVFEKALRQRSRIIAAHPSAEHVRASLKEAPEADALQLDRPLPPGAATALAREIEDAHCGHAPAAMLTAMQRAQSYKDAFMARELERAGAPAVLITGRGHGRKDRGVPRFLGLRGAGDALSVGLVDVSDAARQPSDYEEADQFDLVIFTPRTTDEDACTRFKKQLEGMRGPGR